MDKLEAYLEVLENYLKEQEELNGVFDPDDRKCRVCGCTQFNACSGGCYWIEGDLCSRCAVKGEDTEKRTRAITEGV